MSKGSFRRALLEVDRDLASVPHVRELSVERRRIGWRLPVLAFAVAAAIALFVFTRSRDSEVVQVAGFAIDAPSSHWHTQGDAIEVRATSLDFDVEDFGQVVADHGAVVARITDGIHVVRGRVDIAVTHRPSRAAIVRVSHGTIAVLGTRFTIEQSAQGGRVVLHEGRIRFDAGERSVILNPGESLEWPLAKIAATPTPPLEPTPPVATTPAAPPINPARVEEAAPPAPPAPSTPSDPGITPSDGARSAPAPTIDVERVVADLANLRARRRFADAARLLEQTLAHDLPSTMRERLDYELGDIRTHQLADRERACRHWQSHRTRFPQGRYTTEIDAAVRRLGCEETTP